MTATQKHSDADHQALTEQFFQEMEEQILGRLQREAKSPEGREELLRATGIKDAHLLDELGKLGITVDGLLALRLFPLVLVAWAEANADAKERDVVMREAVRTGIDEDSAAWVLLDQWLVKRPPGLGVDAWKRYTHGVFQKMSAMSRKRLVELTKEQMNEVAKASGGHLGFGRISSREKAVIRQVIEAMNHL
ncbi:hypothetical protein SAMN06265222_101840 [Neorhodopirellula lusitana]|uniref:Uncharacterized protein n=1 Tax=Neorhodopirellula lusitana TaxID=445327 RepID=A0ABY1PT52_9BACT|nr:hypothetical protein [Neorhodopirellula lusitana]SMP42777.1 hypothetical protein SAMN06265222_101840 [Neorhodopirellula lusitana]